MPSNRVSIHGFVLIGFALWALPITPCSGDFVLYTPPGARASLILEGKTKTHNANLIEFSYPGYPSIALDRTNTVVIKAPTRLEEYKKLDGAANRAKNADAHLEAAQYALRHGKLREFYASCGEAYKLEPQNPTLTRLIQTRKMIKAPISGFDEAEAELRRITKLSTMSVARSEHYVMLHDIKENPTSKKSRVARRLALLELVYESFLLKFSFQGTVLTPPKEPMMVLLFSEEKDYLRYATQLDPHLSSAAGFWSSKDNISVFFDRGTTQEMKMLTAMIEDLQRLKVRARQTTASREVAQLTNSLDLIVKITKDEADVEVVTHEATHQLAGNTGLIPRDKLGLAWAHEGLASYFETPAGAGWGGVGAVNPKRLRGYRSIAGDPTRNKLEFLISDFLFDAPEEHVDPGEAYGYAWALTHYLMEHHSQKLIEYYRRSSEIEGDSEGKISRKEIVELFESVFGDIGALEFDFHRHMSLQQSKVERMLSAIVD